MLSSPYANGNLGTAVNYGSGPISALAHRYTTYDYVAGEDNTKKGFASFDNSNAIYNVASKKVDTAAYSRTLDYFIFGGNQQIVHFYNATNKNNTIVQSVSLACNIMSSDFTDNG
jgi:hypothetical protein